MTSTYLIPLFWRLRTRSSLALWELCLLDVPLLAARLYVDLQTMSAILTTTDAEENIFDKLELK